jgi:hypothetical protein
MYIYLMQSQISFSLHYLVLRRISKNGTCIMNCRFAYVLLIALIIINPLVGKEKNSVTKKKKTIRKEYIEIQDNPELPRVLLIGDSISVGYTIPTRKLLDNKANVHRALANCGPTIRGLKNLDRWLGEKTWDVIHFNWGLHDIVYLKSRGPGLSDPIEPGSKPQVPLVEYEKNLRKLVAKLKETNAKLVWCTTTPVPEGSKARIAGDEVKYNKVAAIIMKEEGIQINDLHKFAETQLEDIQRPTNVHFTKNGSKVLAEQVAKSITEALAKKPESK